jgi:hypothetical protein
MTLAPRIVALIVFVGALMSGTGCSASNSPTTPDASVYFKIPKSRDKDLLDTVQLTMQRDGFSVLQRSERLPKDGDTYFVLYMESEAASVAMLPHTYRDCYFLAVYANGDTERASRIKMAVVAAIEAQFEAEVIWRSDELSCEQRQR